MTQWVENEISAITTNDVNSGAIQVSPNFSRWSFEWPGGLSFPDNVSNLTLEIPQASIWYSSFLVETGLNDTVDANILGVYYPLTFPSGLWSVSDLSTRFQELLAIALGVSTFADKIIIAGVPATGKIKLIFSEQSSDQVLGLRFQDNSIGPLLGF